MAKWRATAAVEPPAWVRRYQAADWTSHGAWMAACDGWFDAHAEATEARWAWVLSITDEPFNPYVESA